MCGVFGYAVLDPACRAGRPALAAMAASLAHRGPDGWGTEDAGWAGLGATRLRLIDPRPAADPPAHSEDGRVVAVLNGEIYNHEELREGLLVRGHRLADRSDAALLPHLWEEDGEGLFARLRGAFAIAVLDRRRECLVLARDRLGEKPLVVADGPEAGADGMIVFASEPRALAASGVVRPEVDPDDLGGFLRFGYVPSPHTGLRGIRRLEAGSLSVFSRAAGRGRTRRYWRPDPAWTLPHSGADRSFRPEGLMERLRTGIEAAVREQLVADRPTAVVLSGGIDSGLVAAAAVRSPRPPLEALTVRVPGQLDEVPLATRTADLLGLPQRIVELGPPDPDEVLRTVARIGEPLADSSALAVDRLCAAAARDVVALLVGDGGDELFGGYRRFVALRLAALTRRSNGTRSETTAPPGGAALRGQVLAGGRSITRFWRARRATLGELPAYWRSLFWDGDAPGLLDRSDLGPWPRTAAGPLARWGTGGPDPLERARLEELAGPLQDDLLVKMDRLSMAHGVEVRCPLLDHRLVEQALSIPARRSVGWFTTKRLLRRLAAVSLPRAVARARKRGFGVPLGCWLRGPLRPMLADLAASLRRGEGPFRAAYVERLLAAHLAGREDHGQRLWALVVWQNWRRQVSAWCGPPESQR